MSLSSSLVSYYDISDYSQKIESLTREKPSTTDKVIEAKSIKILRQLSKVLVKDWDNNPFYATRFNETVDQALLDLSRLRPGRRLFKRLLKSPFPIVIRLGNDFDQKMDIRYAQDFNWQTFEVQFTKAFINLPRDYLTKEKNNHCMPDGYPIAIGLAHELIHAMHTIEDQTSSIFRGAQKTNLFNPHFHDLEEQLTICGLEKKDGSIELCENAFVGAFGYHFRLTHHSHPAKAYPQSLKM